MVEEVVTVFVDADVDVFEVEQDAKDFFSSLEKDGFIVSGETPEELDSKDVRFSYAELVPKTIREDFTPDTFRTDANTQEYLEKHFKDNPQLMSLQIELTSRCNERCVHCYIPHANKNSAIMSELFYSILEQCHDMGVLDLTFSGGEPMLHPDFIDFLRKSKEYDFSISILSNLTLLNDEIVTAMKESRLSGVQVSLYSMDAAIHDAITQMPGSFVKTRDAILRLIENDIPLQISCPAMKQNHDSYANVAKWAAEHKVRAFTDFIMMARYDHTTDNLDNRLSLDEMGKVINDIIDNDFVYQERLKEANFDEIEKIDISENILCGVCILSCCMVANGDIYPCAGWQGYVCGNVAQQPLREIWNSSPKVQYLRSLRKKDMAECADCADRQFCAVCMVRNANENPDGDPLKINQHFCRVAALNRKIVLDWQATLRVKR